MAGHDPSSSHILITGAGLAGSLLACSLGRKGYRVSVYERRPDPRARGFIGGRSINLALSTRGITALEEVDLAERVLDQAIPMHGRMMHGLDSELTFQPYSANPEDAINSVSRSDLNLTLLDAADAHENVTLHFDRRCVSVDLDQPVAVFEASDRGMFEEIKPDLIIGTDGAFSAVRAQMQKTDRFNYSQHYPEHGYKELTIPPADQIPDFGGKNFDGFALDPNALHIWPRGGYMMIALPNQDRTFTCTCFWPYRGKTSFESIMTEDDVIPFFERHFPDAVPLMPTLKQDYMKNPTSSLVTIRCFPWHHRDKVVILGDAAHAIVPFYGQGMNAAFEDCRILNGLFDRHAPHWDIVLETFTMSRKHHADAIADMAMENFIEMRDKVGSKGFLLKKKIEQILHRLFPNTFVPLYNLISFSNVPYADARNRALGQERLLLVLACVVLGVTGIMVLIILVWLLG